MMFNLVEAIIAICLVGQSGLIIFLGYVIFQLKIHINSLETKIMSQERILGDLQVKLTFKCQDCQK